MAETDTELADLKKQKTHEEIVRLRLQNKIASNELCNRRAVLELLAPIIGSIIDDYSTAADELSTDLAGLDAAEISRRISAWSTVRLERVRDRLKSAAHG